MCLCVCVCCLTPGALSVLSERLQHSYPDSPTSGRMNDVTAGCAALWYKTCGIYHVSDGRGISSSSAAA